MIVGNGNLPEDISGHRPIREYLFGGKSFTSLVKEGGEGGDHERKQSIASLTDNWIDNILRTFNIKPLGVRKTELATVGNLLSSLAGLKHNRNFKNRLSFSHQFSLFDRCLKLK